MPDIAKFKKKLTWQLSTAYIAKLALLTAIAFILYAFCKFSLPFMFPSFLDIQFSELPALLAGFSMGPLSGCIVIVLKCLFKLPMTGTFYVGELTDMIIGICFVLPATLIYRRHKDKKHALIGLGVSTVIVTVVSVILNRFISIPFYVEFFFKGSWQSLLDICGMLYPGVTKDSFYAFYLGLGIAPFNLLRCFIVSLLTFLLYKRLSKILHWDGSKHRVSGNYESDGVDDTLELAGKIAASLNGGDIVILDGELGAGKTTFTKGIAASLGVTEEITSPTFTIMNVYESGRLKLNHLDMYRLESADDTYELGVEEAVGSPDSVTVIEWNKLERLTGRIITVKIVGDGENTRRITVSDSADAKNEGKRTRKKSEFGIGIRSKTDRAEKSAGGDNKEKRQPAAQTES